MNSRIGWALLATVLVIEAGAAAALPEAVDLSALDTLARPPAPAASVWDDAELAPVAARTGMERRVYVTGLLGESFASLSDPLYALILTDRRINRSVFTAGGAAGTAFWREDGQLRLEVEGRWRDDVTASFDQSLPPLSADFRWAAADGWSALFNVWRDFSIGEQVDLYLGGGVGGGGYRYGMTGDVSIIAPLVTYAAKDQVAAFAWQAGGGMIWNVSDRVAFDVGYRFFSLDQADVALSASLAGVPVGTIGLPQQFTASELLFGLRIYEPFRRWR